MSAEEGKPNEETAVVNDDAEKKNKLVADIEKSAPRVMKHMNNDHGDSLIAFVLAFATGVEHVDDDKLSSNYKNEALFRQVFQGKRTIQSAKLTQVDMDGFLLEVLLLDHNDGDGVKEEGQATVISSVRVPYDRPIQRARDLHVIAVSMHRKAYDKLGVWYKTKNGYYASALKLKAYTTFKTIKKMSSATTTKSTASVVVIGVFITATSAAGYYYVNNKQNGIGSISRSTITAT